MKPPIFDYVAAETIEAALDTLAASGGEAKVIAGGQSLMPMLNFRLARPALLVDITRIPGLADIREDGSVIRAGALVRHHTLEMSPLIAARLPVLSAAMAHVAHLAIRNRGTIGGSLSHADPAAELPMMAVLLDATLTIRSVRGMRTEAAADFFKSALTTSLAPDEIVTEVGFSVPEKGSGWGFEEVARRDGDFALAAVAALMKIEHGRIRKPRIALMGVGETPLRARTAEALLDGQTPGPELFAKAAATVREGLEPNTDLHASSEYRLHLAGVLTKRVLEAATQRAGGAR
jgi:CO/xanthine dehydrogenase FAD-binding subunit